MDINPIRKSVRRVRKFLKKAPNEPGPEMVHDLRTSTRRLEAAFEAFVLEGRKGQKQKLLQDLQRIRRKAGRVRDLDVFTQQALGIETRPEEQDCLLEVIEHLGASRAKEARKLHAAARKVRSRLRRELKRGWSGIEPVFESNGYAADAAKQSRAQAAAMEAQLAGDLRLPLRLNRRNLHPYRLKVKDLRYLLQLEDRRNEKKFLEKLGQVKDAIGEWHDWEELRAIAAALLNHGARCKLLETMKATSDAKYKRALEITLDLRKAYVERAAPRAAKPSVKPSVGPSVKRAAAPPEPAPITIAV